MDINWYAPPEVRFDPNTGDPLATHGIPLPTYGNYGGPHYSAGTIGGTTPEAIDPSVPGQVPVDALDQLSYQHDLVYQHYADGLVQATALPVADVQFVESMAQLTFTDPEAQLYEGFATLAIVGGLAKSGYLETLSFSDLSLVAAATQGAIVNFEAGLTAVPSEARSLHGALHVFESRISDFLPALTSQGHG